MSGVLQIKRGVVGVGSLNDGEFYLNKGINAVQIGSGSAILTLLPLNQTVTGDIILNGNIYANNLNISSSYALSSSYSQYAATASYIISSTTSVSASHAATASYILSSNVYGPNGFNSILTSSLALTASYVPGYLQSSATQSMLNGYVLSTQTSSFVTNSQTSSMYVASASNATTSSYAATASFVPNALYSASINSNVIQFLAGDGTTYDLTIDTGSILVGSLLAGTTSGQILYNNSNTFGSVPNITFNGTTLMVSGSLTGSLFGTASWAETASKAISASVAISASYSLTASFSSQSRTADVASYITSSNVYGPNGFDSILSASYSQTASWAVGIIGGAGAVSSSYPFSVTGSTIYSFNSNKVGGTIYNVPITENIIIGTSAAADGIVNNSIFLGKFAGYQITSSINAVFIGENVGQAVSDITGSTFIGYNAGTSTRAAFSNFLGYNAGSNAVIASNSNFLGYNTGRGAYSASYSTLIGYQAGYRTGIGVVGIGNNNIIIGTNITLNDRRTDSINIGGILFGTGSYSTTTGRPYTGSAGGNIGINVPVPTANLHVSGTVKLQNLTTGSYPWVVTYDSASGQLYYTASNGLGGSGSGGASLSGGETNYVALWNSATTLTTSSIYQTGSSIGINTTTPTRTFEVSGSAIISNQLKLGTLPFPTYTSSTGSKLDIIDYIENPTVHPEGYMARNARSIYGSSSFTNFAPYRYEIVSYLRNLELAPGQTYNIAPSTWDARKISLGASLGIGVSGSGTSPNTIYNSGYTLNSTNYAILGKIDYWPEFDAGTLPRQYNGQYSVFGTHVDIQAGSGSTIEKLNSYSAGGLKSFVSTSVDRFINYYSTVETESFSTSKINNIYGFYSAPLYRSYATQSYGFYQSGSNDINYFEGPLGIGVGSITPSGSLYVSGAIYFTSLETGSTVNNVVLYDSSSGKLYYTSSNSLNVASTGGGTISGSGNDGYIALWSGSSALSSSIIFQTGSKLQITGSINTTGSLTITGSTNISGATNILGTTIITKENSTALTVVGSGSASPTFLVYGSQGELFSITDNLSGSLFSVHDISGLPVIETFSDSTTLIGNFQAPALYTTLKSTITTGDGQIIYQLPTASYDAVFYDYTITSGSNARAGQIIARQFNGEVNYAEINTPEFGNTSEFSFGVIVTGSYLALTGSATSNGWVIKTIIRSI